MVKYVAEKKTERVEWEIEGESYGTADAPFIRVDGKAYRPSSIAIFCPECGEVWARRQVISHEAPRWQIRTWTCSRHGGGWLWSGWDEPWNKALPPRVLYRELEFIKRWWDAGVRTHVDLFRLTYGHR